MNPALVRVRKYVSSLQIIVAVRLDSELSRAISPKLSPTLKVLTSLRSVNIVGIMLSTSQF